MRNLILTHYSGNILNNLDKLQRYRMFLRSIEYSKIEADIWMFTTEPGEYYRIGKDFPNLHLMYLHDTEELNGNGSMSRFQMYTKVLPPWISSYEKVIQCDCMDVCFLGDPFPLINKPLEVFEESDKMLFKEEPINCSWSKCMDPTKKAQFYDYHIVCDGVVVSNSLSHFHQFSSMMSEEYESTEKDHLFRIHADQPLTNWISRIHPVFTVTPLKNPLCRHLLRVREPVTEEYCLGAKMIHFTLINNNALHLKGWLSSVLNVSLNGVLSYNVVT